MKNSITAKAARYGISSHKLVKEILFHANTGSLTVDAKDFVLKINKFLEDNKFENAYIEINACELPYGDGAGIDNVSIYQHTAKTEKEMLEEIDQQKQKKKETEEYYYELYQKLKKRYKNEEKA